MAQKRNKMIQDALNRAFEPGEIVYLVNDVMRQEYKVYSVSDDGLDIVIKRIKDSMLKTVWSEDIRRVEDYIGVNPFDNVNKIWSQVHQVCLGSFIHNFDETTEVAGYKIEEYNFYPVVIDKNGDIHEYQRPYVWSLNEQQDFIDSLYNEIDCGVIVLRERSFEHIANEVTKNKGKLDYPTGFFDVVDGKQRLMTLKAFVNDQFPDSNGNYYSDFSVVAKRRFGQINCIKTVTLPPESTDEDVLNMFLQVNYTGVAMSKDYKYNIVALKNTLK